MEPRRAPVVFVSLYLASYLLISFPLGVYIAGLELGWW